MKKIILNSLETLGCRIAHPMDNPSNLTGSWLSLLFCKQTMIVMETAGCSLTLSFNEESREHVNSNFSKMLLIITLRTLSSMRHFRLNKWLFYYYPQGHCDILQFLRSGKTCLAAKQLVRHIQAIKQVLLGYVSVLGLANTGERIHLQKNPTKYKELRIQQLYFFFSCSFTGLKLFPRSSSCRSL